MDSLGGGRAGDEDEVEVHHGDDPRELSADEDVLNPLNASIDPVSTDQVAPTVGHEADRGRVFEALLVVANDELVEGRKVLVLKSVAIGGWIRANVPMVGVEDGVIEGQPRYAVGNCPKEKHQLARGVAVECTRDRGVDLLQPELVALAAPLLRLLSGLVVDVLNLLLQLVPVSEP